MYALLPANDYLYELQRREAAVQLCELHGVDPLDVGIHTILGAADAIDFVLYPDILD